MAVERERWRKEQEDQRRLSIFYGRYGVPRPTDSDLSSITPLKSWNGKRPSGIIWWIYRRAYLRNLNCITAMTGSSGSGKSYSSICLSSLLDDDFSIERNVAFSPEEFVNAVSSDRRAIILDDAGMQVGSRDSQTRTNKRIGQIFQGIRFRNNIIFLTMPSLGMVDLQLRSQAHIFAHCLNVNPATNQVNTIVQFLDVGSKDGKTYYHNPIIVDESGFYRRILSISIPKPRRDLVDSYEKKKAKFFDEFLNIGEFGGKNERGKEAKDGKKEPKLYEIVGRSLRHGLSLPEIAEILNRPEKDIRNAFDYLRRSKSFEY
jgi:hypothetical protein